MTASQPKAFTEIAGRRVLDWTLDAFRDNGLDSFVFVGGYLMENVRREYPDLTFVENAEWPTTNILYSLLCARDHFRDGFYATYTDTLFRPDAVQALEESHHHITLVMDTLWRERYRYRSQHPEHDAEKMTVTGDRVTRASRHIEPEVAAGEFTGVLRMSAAGAAQFLDFYNGLHRGLGDEGEIVEGTPLRMAYLLQLLDRMVEAGIDVHCVPVPGEYHEIDTLQDYELASRLWEAPGG